MAHSVSARLLRIAKARDEDFHFLLVRYRSERFRYRIGTHPSLSNIPINHHAANPARQAPFDKLRAAQGIAPHRFDAAPDRLRRIRPEVIERRLVAARNKNGPHLSEPFREHQFINSYAHISRFCCMDHWKACHALLNKHPCSSQELNQTGVARSTISRWVQSGRILRLAHGLYGLPDAAYDEHHSLVLAQGQMPKGILCLLSALQFHGITSQLPREVWMAMEGGTHQPRVTGINVRVCRFTGEAYSSGIETHQVEGGSLRVYGVTKTVIDCFRMRNKIGVDIAIEALRDALRSRKTTIGELESTAARLRARTILRPYLEMAAAS